MKKFAVTLTVIAFLFSIALGVYIYDGVKKQLAVQAKCPPSVIGIKSIPFEVTIKATVKDIPKGAKRLDLWMPYPQNRKAQSITNVSIKSPYPVTVSYEPEYGNAIMHLGLDNPREGFDLEMKISAVREEALSVRFLEEHAQALDDKGEFTLYKKDDPCGKVTPEMTETARKAYADKTTVLDKARGIYTYVMDSYEKEFQNKYLPGVPRCAEINTLYGALLRAEGIPVRVVNGFTFKRAEEGKLGEYGCRSEFYAAGYGWLPVDLESGKKFPEDMKFYFGNLDENRLEMVTGRSIQLIPPQKGGRIDVFLYPYAEVDGKAIEVGREISWKKEL